MRELTEALLLLSRSDSGALAVLRKELDLAELVQDVATSLSALAEEKSLQFDLQLQPAQTMGDVGSLSQVVTNLLHNAVKFSKPGGVIRLKTRRDKGRAVLEVQDNGVGISATDLPHIFERFYRGDQSRTGSGSYGLGLAIARSIVETHGGEIQVESVEGFGARFVVLLP